ncbi:MULTISPECIES: phBC6A51 family helix-turn-helix protein [Bacteroidales]|uniref:phBC6A51 family helix-turn-helix protein n=1 Tax=Bacteroidales TaxID=171549 RepID=UPI0035A132A1
MAKYGKKIISRIVELVKSDTYTIAEICQQAGISISTFYQWQEEHEEFKVAIEEAHEARMQLFVQEAKKSLMKKIQGYDVTETKVVTVPNKNDPNRPTIKEQTTTKKHFQPDTAAIIFTLTNGDPTRWRNRQTTEVTGKDGKELFRQMSDEDLDKEISDLEKKLDQ